MSAVDAYRDFLGDVEAFRIDGLDRLGIPVVSASAWGEPEAHGVGYGASEHDAERGALGETVETLAAARYAARVRPRRLTIAEARAQGAVCPEDLSPPLGPPPAEDRELAWVMAEVWPEGSERLVPLEAVVSTRAEYDRAAPAGLEPLFPPITNGHGAGAGDDLERAVRHGFEELLQRDLNWSQFKALDTGRSVDAGAVVPELVARLRAAGVTPVLKYSGHLFGVHAFHAAALDEDPATPAVMRACTGEGAHPDPATAARKALLELCSSRSRKRFFFGGEAGLEVAPEHYRRRFAGAASGAYLEAGVDLAERFGAMLADPGRVVERIGQVAEVVPMPPPGGAPAPPEILVVCLTEPGDAATAVKVIVPGLEAEVLSHLRLGPRAVARLRDRCPHAVHDGPDAPGPGWERGPGAWIDAGWLRATAEAFFPLYREPDRHRFAAP